MERKGKGAVRRGVWGGDSIGNVGILGGCVRAHPPRTHGGDMSCPAGPRALSYLNSARRTGLNRRQAASTRAAQGDRAFTVCSYCTHAQVALVSGRVNFNDFMKFDACLRFLEIICKNSCRLETIPNGGHSLHLHPKTAPHVNQLMLDFLNEENS